MTNESRKIERIPIGKLKPSLEHAEVFTNFKRKYTALRRRIRVEGFDENYPLIVRKIKGGRFEILCGFGRYKYIKDLDQQNAITKRQPSELLCEVVDMESEEAIILILKDNFQTCRAITDFTDFQYFLLGILLYESNATKYSKEDFKDHIIAELNVSETAFYQLSKSLEWILQRLKEEKDTDEY